MYQTCLTATQNKGRRYALTTICRTSKNLCVCVIPQKKGINIWLCYWVMLVILRSYVTTLKEPRLLSRYSDSLRAGRSGDRIPVGARFSVHVHTGPGAHPASQYNGYRVFHGGKAAGAWCWPPTPSNTEVKERVELYLYSPSGPSWSVLGWPLPLPLCYNIEGKNQFGYIISKKVFSSLTLLTLPNVLHHFASTILFVSEQNLLTLW
jgi:hypothetical protein